MTIAPRRVAAAFRRSGSAGHKAPEGRKTIAPGASPGLTRHINQPRRGVRSALSPARFNKPAPVKKLDLKITAHVGRSHVPFLRKMLPRAHALLHSPLKELSIALIGDQQMSQLHDRFMGQPHPTDVLTFPLEEDSRRRALSGEIVICVPQAIRQAKSRGIPLQNELLLYALHGMLHLLGLDDRTSAGYRRIHSLEDQVLTALGIGPVFSTSQPHSRKPRKPRNPGEKISATP